MSRLSRFLRRAGLTLAAVGVVGAVVGSVWYRRAYTIPPLAPDPPVRLPSPNGYDTLRDAVKLVIKEKDGIKHAYEVTRKTKQPLVGRQKLLAANEPAIAKVREALGQEFLVPPGPENGIGPGAEFRHLARVLASSAETHAESGQLAEAVRCAADTVELGVVTPRGGNLISTLVGGACESIGDASLWALVDRLDAPTARATAQRLERIETRRWPVAEMVRAEGRGIEKSQRALYNGGPARAWRNTGEMFGAGQEVASTFNRIAGFEEPPQPALTERVRDWAQTSWFKAKIAYRGPKSTLDELDRVMAVSIARAESPWDASHATAPAVNDPMLEMLLPVFSQGAFAVVRTRTETALLTTWVALRTIRVERGRYPESLDALTRSGILKALPIDPFSPTRSPLRYRRNADGTITLYSVGPDARDDGGKPVALRGVDGKLRHRIDIDSVGDYVARIDTR